MVWMKMIAVNMVVVRRRRMTCRGRVGGEVFVFSLEPCFLILCTMKRTFATLTVCHLTTWRLDRRERIILISLLLSIVHVIVHVPLYVEIRDLNTGRTWRSEGRLILNSNTFIMPCHRLAVIEQTEKKNHNKCCKFKRHKHL